MITFFRNFIDEDSGAVTVDWVVLTAAVVALAALAYVGIAGGSETLSSSVGNALDGTTVSSGTATGTTSTSGGIVVGGSSTGGS